MSAVDAGPAWSAWSRVTPVTAAPAARERYTRVVLPFTIAPAPDGGYPDLRVVSPSGEEIPYAVDPEHLAAEDRKVPLTDAGFIPRRGTQAVADLGTSGDLAGAISLDVDAVVRPTYFVRVALDASDDRKIWRIVRDDAIVYRVAEDHDAGNDTVAFPPTRSRWLRVRILDPGSAFPLIGARIAAPQPADPALAQLPLQPHERDDPAAHERSWTFAATNPIRPAAVSFADGGALYERLATVEASDDGATWTSLAESPIAHYAEGGAQTTVALQETTARYVRVTVSDGDDAPVASLRPTLLARRHAIVFAAGASRLLLSGNPAATAPSYDLSARLAHENWRAGRAHAEVTVPNPGYRDPRPVGERFPWLVTTALVAVAVLLGGLAFVVTRPSGP